ncbi:MAG: ATP-binding cassette domain-containing protein, partial [Omnitrophica WOR_2 bacterium]
YGNKMIFSNVNYVIQKNDFIAFVGKNGEGKTTMAKVIVENLEHTGECKLGYNVKIGYYAQNQAELLDPERSVFETIDDIAVGDIRPKVRNILGSFLFTGEDIEKKVKVLSGGEKSRLALAKLLLAPVNLLVLDEPTNHLDMMSKDILKNALLMFDGTLIVVSHDRDFLQGLTRKVFEFKDGNVKQHIGDIYDFLEKRKISHLDQLTINSPKSQAKQSADEPSNNKQQYEKRKLFEKEIRKVTNKIDKAEEEIKQLENEISSIDKILGDPLKYKDVLNDTELYNKYNKLKQQLDQLMITWGELNEEADEMRKSNS